MPSFNSFGFLPEGIHEVSWAELEEHFAQNATRQCLLKGLWLGLQALALAGCSRAYIDGSFVTSKLKPGDIDVCYDSGGMDFRVLDPVLKDFSNRRAAQKAKFGCEFFEAEAAIPDGTLYLIFPRKTGD